MRADVLIRVLRTVPEKRLRLVELARELADDEGELDLEKAAAHLDEVHLATQEASVYAQATGRVLRWLNELAH